MTPLHIQLSALLKQLAGCETPGKENTSESSILFIYIYYYFFNTVVSELAQSPMSVVYMDPYIKDILGCHRTFETAIGLLR